MATHENLSRDEPLRVSSERSFGGVFALFFMVIALWPPAFGGAVRWWAVIVSALLAVAALAAPSLLAIPNMLWYRFGLLLHRIVSPVVLAILFYGVVTPTGLIMRLFGRDPMRRRRDPGVESYWINREPPGPEPESLKRLF